ncbi:MAG TPA: aminotransferase class V-fold PLP-dependent enzyme [Planctomycetota bacterium]|nr:aminotransferase class V-fold PLP-dependent enzyme [Planctomycetota bacterium]
MSDFDDALQVANKHDTKSSLLQETATRILKYRNSTAERPVAPVVEFDKLLAAFGGPLPTRGSTPEQVIEQLVAAAEPGLVATTGPRYFGFVVGGALESATCADMLAIGWDQPAFNAVTSPAAAAVEQVVGEWLKQLLRIPAGASFGLVTGGQGANTVALAAARHRVLANAGWDVEAQGLFGAPSLRVIASVERHATIDRSLRLLGLGTRGIVPVAADSNGAIDTAELARVLASGAAGPTIVCLQAGNVNTGACDDLARAAAIAHRHGAWVHVDGAFGLWAAACERTAPLVAGIEQADSWSVDGHKWLNVPYDSGYVFCADAKAHLASMSFTAAYLVGHGRGSLRAPSDYVPESSRRARGFATWAALRELGTCGVSDLVERCCALARRFGEALGRLEGVTIGNAIVLNQVLVSFGSDERTERILAAVQREGTCWMGGTTWRGRRYMRISVSNWSTTEDDVDRSVAAIRGAMSRA